MAIEIIQPEQKAATLPWGIQIRMLLPIPELVATGNRNIIVMNRGSHKRHVMKDAKAATLRAHLGAAAQRALGVMKQRQPELASLHFPICGSECPLRIDVVFCFCAENRGYARLLRADEDNLKKGVYDAIKGIIVDDDNWIVEGYWAKAGRPRARRRMGFSSRSPAPASATGRSSSPSRILLYFRPGGSMIVRR